jgi:hypothetical protein
MKNFVKLRLLNNITIEKIRQAIGNFLIRLLSEIVIRLLSDYLILLT